MEAQGGACSTPRRRYWKEHMDWHAFRDVTNAKVGVASARVHQRGASMEGAWTSPRTPYVGLIPTRFLWIMECQIQHVLRAYFT